MSSEKKISDLDTVPSLDNTALYEIEQGGVSFKVALSAMNPLLVGIDSINTDTTSAQLLTGQTNKILIADDLAGNHTFTIGTDIALVSNNLGVFAATTSLQLLGVMSDEVGTGLLVFNDTPIIITPTIASFVNATHSHLNAAGGGLITAASISDFDTQVRTSRLEQMATPTSSVSFGNQLITLLLDPVSAQDAATKNYVDAIAINGVKWKESGRVASTANINLGVGGLLTIDGVLLVAGDRVLAKDQTLGQENGIYDAAIGAWNRSSDADTSAEILQMAIFVEEGTVSTDQGFVLTTNAPIVLDTTVLVYTQFTGLGQITAGINLTKTGNTLDFDPTGGVDMLGNNLINVGFFESNATNIPTAGVIRLGNAEEIRWRNSANSNDFRLNFSSADLARYVFDNIIEYTWSITEADFLGNNLVNMGILQFVDANQTIQNNAGNLFYDVATGQVHLWRINNVTEMQLSATALAMQGNAVLQVAFLTSYATNPASAGTIRLGNTELIEWRNAANTDNISLGVDSSDDFVFTINGVSTFALGATTLVSSSAGGNFIYTLNATSAVVDNTILYKILAQALDGGSILKSSSSIIMTMESDVAGSEDGSIRFEMVVSGSHDVRFFALNDGSSGTIDMFRDITLADNVDFIINTTTGTKIGTGATQKIGFWNATPIVQPAHIIDADGTLADITTKFNTLLADLAAQGLQAAS